MDCEDYMHFKPKFWDSNPELRGTEARILTKN